MDRHSRMTFRNVHDGSKRRLKPKPKHPYKLHVWAGISCRGSTKIFIFDGIMRKDFYTDTILKEGLLPFLKQRYPDGHRFMQDNDPKHTSKYADDFMKKENINWIKSPAESPDMNPIEMVWNEMKCFLRKIHKPTTKDELREGRTERRNHKVLDNTDDSIEVSKLHFASQKSNPSCCRLWWRGNRLLKSFIDQTRLLASSVCMLGISFGFIAVNFCWAESRNRSSTCRAGRAPRQAPHCIP
ncbi:uncharacterized protein LOC119727812 [Patiria miniata]|uniref:Tc1-like transposase DDE domain-containing protein n=1 Tax=Patiria miniata TaxID=46514 RepID=A0A913ZVW9_PATMI|nr:uncharacterized protein LOC119727812 [Patiria miniata]